MPSQGPFSPGTLANDASFGSVAWSNPGNAGSSDDSYATASPGFGASTNYLKVTNFGFSIPAGATIDGIVVEIERSNPTPFSDIVDERVRIVKGGTIGSTERSSGASWPSSDAYATFGSASDTWGETWSAGDINASTFGVAIAVTNPGAGSPTARVDHVRITVHYTVAGTSFTGNFSLFIGGHETLNLGAPLFVGGHDVGSGNPPLYIGGAGYGTGLAPLFVEGSGDPIPASGNITLFTSGLDTGSGWTPLFVGGYQAGSGSFSLFVSSIGTGSGSTTLYGAGHEPASGLAPLYTAGHAAASGALRLFLRADDIPPASGHFGLFVFGTANSGEFAAAPLYTFSDASGNIKTGVIPLSVLGVSQDSDLANLNLVVTGRAHDAAGGLDLFVFNDTSGVSLTAPMYVSGDGTAAGAMPADSTLNLVLVRDPANAVSLFTKGPGALVSGDVSLYVFGAYTAATGLPLSVADAVGYQTKMARLYTNGF